ncbi:MAG: hypothetical protein ACRDYB_08595 [Acidimicrobiales bacterium]
MKLVGRALRSFGRFWFDFLFGDSLVLLPATIAIAAIAYGLRHDRAADMVVVPALVVALVTGSAWLGRRRPQSAEPPEHPTG